ncbi:MULTISPECIES: hypothetical protein [Borreliella]|uniref:Lipoprotein n=1 Tax=Borrelia garinii subsp. bavariensis (strain ATCC BAA-2496 / DSM 23469 / PBi) TaxID=290434 RepID=A0A7I6GXW6_BORGP|nr:MULTISPECIES: hypothetical protein [Borreliella]AAU86134.1 hypothetical protein BGP283 [Borreliella bavariensis PBi]WLN24631.1 hypothetical protein IDK87_05085 [Borreliella bavariensis]
MKYLVFINVFFLLFLACIPDFGINKKNIKLPSSKKALNLSTEVDPQRRNPK